MRISKLTLSYNSSDVDAYKNESPIPVVKMAYLEYERNKRKAAMRRAIQIKNGELELDELEKGVSDGRKSQAIGRRGEQPDLDIEEEN